MNELKRKPRKIDIKFNGLNPQDPGMGPVEARFQSFGKPLTLVVGPRGEMSDDFEYLIRRFAEKGAERMWRRMGARSIKEARGVIKTRLYRSFGITAARGYARMIADRFGVVLGDGDAAYGRRSRSREAYTRWWDEYFRQFDPSSRGAAGRGD